MKLLDFIEKLQPGDSIIRPSHIPIVDYDLNYEGLYNLITTKKRYD